MSAVQTTTIHRLSTAYEVGDLLAIGWGCNPTYRNPEDAWVKVIAKTPSAVADCSDYFVAYVAHANYGAQKPPAWVVDLAATI